MKSAFDQILKIQPEKIVEQTKEELVKNYDLVRQVGGILEVMKKEVGAELLTRFEGNGTVICNFSVSRTRKPSYSKVSLETAREFGAVCDSLDTKKLAELIKKGIEVAGVTYSEYPTVTSLTKSKNEEEVV